MISRKAVVAAVGLALLGALPVTSAQAAVTTSTVAFATCDVRTVQNDPNTRVGSRFAWSPVVTIDDVASPAKLNEWTRTYATISDFPADKLPVAIPEAAIHYELEIRTSHGTTKHASGHASRPHAAGAGVLLGESENDVYFSRVGYEKWYAGEFTLSVEGWVGEHYQRYYAKCDAPASSPLLATIAVYDPAAKAAASVSPASILPGGRLTVSGTGFRPDESVAISLDGAQLTTLPTDRIGAFSYSWNTAASIKVGTHTVTLTGALSNRTVSAKVSVVAKPAAVVKARALVSPAKAKRGKAVTVTGQSFRAGERVKIVLKRTAKKGKGLKAQSVAAITANSKGTLVKKFKVSKKLAKGAHTVVLTGASSGRTAVAKLKLI